MSTKAPHRHTRPALAVTSSRIDSLNMDPKNPRQHSDKQVRQIAKSIESFGFNVPVLMDARRNVIAGHGRLLAVKTLGWTEVPTITLDHLSPDQVQAYRIADNRLTENSSWDERLLGESLKLLSDLELDFELYAIGFELPEIDLRIQSLEFDGEEGPEAVELPLSDGPTIAKPGDLWIL